MFNLFRKKSPNAIENYALKLTLEWGKNLGKEIDARLIKKYPKLSKQEVKIYKELCKNVENDCWNSFDYNGTQINIEEFDNLLINNVFKKYTWINNRNKSDIKSKFQYYLWKDGIIK